MAVCSFVILFIHCIRVGVKAAPRGTLAVNTPAAYISTYPLPIVLTLIY